MFVNYLYYRYLILIYYYIDNYYYHFFFVFLNFVLIYLKLLNYFATNSQNRLIVELHNVFKHKFLKLLKQNFNSSTYISLPNKVFFEQGLILQNNTGKTYAFTGPGGQDEFFITPNTPWVDKNSLYVDFGVDVASDHNFGRLFDISVNDVQFKVYNAVTNTNIQQFQRVMFEIRIYS